MAHHLDDSRLFSLAHPASRSVLWLAPTAGFCGVSWSVDDIDHLHLSQPLDQFLEEEHTGGLPLLYPWANRLRGDRYRVGTTEVDLTWVGNVHRDGGGLPMHGLLLRWGDWETTLTDGGCTASIHWGEHAQLRAAFPFDHRLSVTWRLDLDGLEVTTCIVAGSDRVPVCFGWHPYLVLPGVSRDAITLQLPNLEPLGLDGQGLPNPDATTVPMTGDQPLAQRAWDHGFTGVVDGDVIEMRGGGRGLQMTLCEGYRALQIYSPAEADWVCIEPMTARTAALSDETATLLDPGCTYRARFRIRVLPPNPRVPESPASDRDSEC